jgi:ankyrin repeat and fibronectin type-III domain-containing protein 1
LYYEDKVLVTNEDFIPVIEIDETYSSSLHGDYYWLMKVSMMSSSDQKHA